MTLKILALDPGLQPYEYDLQNRMSMFEETRKRLLDEEQTLSDFANGYLYFGFHQLEEEWVFREWAPHASRAWLVGDFNKWEEIGYEMKRIEGGIWELSVPGNLPQGSKVKVILLIDGEKVSRVPSYILQVVQNEKWEMEGVVFQPSYHFQNQVPVLTEAPLIYEAHIGISSEEHKVNTYQAFTQDVLPRIKADGYNTIQLMGIMEHLLYSSFGYQVSNFYAASAWFGTPDDLMALIDTAHGLGIRVLLDVVHSHAVKNIGEGLNFFDGTPDQYFYEGARGSHEAWGTKLFNYGKDEVLHFLLSNLKFWMEVYRFDGFRFDGVTSMIYHHHGLNRTFGPYEKYFSKETHVEAVTYLMLANQLIHQVNPQAITIAEDVSAMPGMALSIEDGGIGFDYRLSMGIPDYWIEQFKDKTDENFDLSQVWWELTIRRPGEKIIGYVESHDQALMGDQTIMMWLAGQEIYEGMKLGSVSERIDRAMGWHKLVRLLTFSLGGEGYLNFMGNEFGHPEWLDFPREDNGYSYQYARRQWSLVDNEDLRFKYLAWFDRAMIGLEIHHHILEDQTFPKQYVLDKKNQTLVYQRGELVFAFNFHPQSTQTIILSALPSLNLVLDTNAPEFGGLEPSSRFDQDGTGTLWLHLKAKSAYVFKVDSVDKN